MNPGQAISYNDGQGRINWRLRELPAPFKDNEPGTRRFAEMVYIFQVCSGLEPDGMLGPITLHALKKSDLAAGMKEAREEKEAAESPKPKKKTSPKKATASSS